MYTRVGRWLLAIALLIVTGFAAIYINEYTRGDLDWQSYVEESRADGKKLAISQFYSPEIPDAENFAAAPLFVRHATTKGVLKNAFSFEDNVDLRLSDFEKCRIIDLEPWVKHFRKRRWSTSGLMDTDAGEILKVLERFDVLLSELKDAADRPRAQFADAWDKSSAADSHLVPLKYATTLLALRSEATLCEQSGPGLLDDVRLLIRIAYLSHDVPGTYGLYLHGNAVVKACNVIWHGLVIDAWEVAALVKIEDCFNQLKGLAQIRWHMDSERALINAFYDEIPELVSRGIDVGINHIIDNGFLKPGELIDAPGELFDTLTTSGWAMQNKTRSNRHLDDLLSGIHDVRGIYRRQASKWEPTGCSCGYSHGHSWTEHRFRESNQIGHRLQSELEGAIRVHNRIQQVLLACKLKRYLLKYGRYPASIEALVPEFFNEVPHDVCDGAPMRYRLDTERGYVLYSVGLDRKDDGGVPPNPRYYRQNPDWIWTYPPQ